MGVAATRPPVLQRALGQMLIGPHICTPGEKSSVSATLLRARVTSLVLPLSLLLQQIFMSSALGKQKSFKMKRPEGLPGGSVEEVPDSWFLLGS